MSDRNRERPMTALLTEPAASNRTGETLDAVLSPTHDAWVEEARQFLMPATSITAPFWDRWTVVRYLDDQFFDHLRLETALVEELRPFVTPSEMAQLRAGGERVAQLRLALDRIGRRRGTAPEFAPVTDELLRALELWCAEIELIGRRIRRDVLPEEGARLLGHLEAGTPGVA